MTTAVCLTCGGMKFGVWTPCDACGSRPVTEDERATSWALSEQNLDQEKLERMSRHIAAGRPFELDEESRRRIVMRLRELNGEMARKIAATRSRSSCFPAESRVLTPYGLSPIGGMQVGDAVLSLSDSGSLVEEIITRKLRHRETDVLRIEFEDGTAIHTTSHHAFLTPTGWCRVNEMELGGHIRKTGDGRFQSFRSIRTIEGAGREVVYNLHTTRLHHFIVEGCVVHNFSTFRGVRTLFHRAFVDPLQQRKATLESQPSFRQHKASK